jgi:hypothetical protein
MLQAREKNVFINSRMNLMQQELNMDHCGNLEVFGSPEDDAEELMEEAMLSKEANNPLVLNHKDTHHLDSEDNYRDGDKENSKTTYVICLSSDDDDDHDT